VAPGCAKYRSGAPRVRAEPPEQWHGRPDRGELVGKQADDVGEHAAKIGLRAYGGVCRAPAARTDGEGQSGGGAGGGDHSTLPSARAAHMPLTVCRERLVKVPAEGAVFVRGMCCHRWWAAAAAPSARRGGSGTGTGMGEIVGCAPRRRVIKSSRELLRSARHGGDAHCCRRVRGLEHLGLETRRSGWRPRRGLGQAKCLSEGSKIDHL